MSTHCGGCICGDIRYELATAPVRSTICYCRFCQVATGSERMVLCVLPSESFRVTHGTPALYEHVSEGSGKTLFIRFCAMCGTKLFVTFERWPGGTGIYSGTLDTPDIVPLDPEHAKQIFVGNARSGTVVMAGLPTYETHATTLEGAPLPYVIPDAPKLAQDLRFPPLDDT